MNVSHADRLDRIRSERPVQEVKPSADPRVDAAAERLREVRAQEKARERQAPERDKGRYVDRYA